MQIKAIYVEGERPKTDVSGNMKFLLGKKKYMTQIFDEGGRVYPVTVVTAGPVTVTQVKTADKDGYNAVQVGYGDRSEKNVTKPLKGHMNGKNFMHLKETRVEDATEVSVGDTYDVSVFEKGDKVSTVSTSKGKGFQGVVKRWGFKGGRRSHGQKHSEREPGSIGATGPQRVFKGKKMGGRMGTDRVTRKKVEIIAVDKEKGEIYLKGGVAGRQGTLVEIIG